MKKLVLSIAMLICLTATLILPAAASGNKTEPDVDIWFTNADGEIVTHFNDGEIYSCVIQVTANRTHGGLKLHLVDDLLDDGIVCSPDSGEVSFEFYLEDDSGWNRSYNLYFEPSFDYAVAIRFLSGSAHLESGTAEPIPDENLFVLGASLGERLGNGLLSVSTSCRVVFDVNVERYSAVNPNLPAEENARPAPAPTTTTSPHPGAIWMLIVTAIGGILLAGGGVAITFSRCVALEHVVSDLSCRLESLSRTHCEQPNDVPGDDQSAYGADPDDPPPPAPSTPKGSSTRIILQGDPSTDAAGPLLPGKIDIVVLGLDSDNPRLASDQTYVSESGERITLTLHPDFPQPLCTDISAAECVEVERLCKEVDELVESLTRESPSTPTDEADPEPLS